MPLAVSIQNPLLWALFIGWILSVTLHEFAHGLVAYLGGDYTIREKGGLTLNPLQYVDPVMSLILPAVIFLMGGVPLPGGATYIRHDLLRSKKWEVAVAAAGPAMNFLLFVLLALPFHPKLRWIDPSLAGGQASAAVTFLGAMAWLQMLAVLFNLIPVPPLDGFQMVAAGMDEETKMRFLRPPLGIALFLGFWFFLTRVPGVFEHFHNGVEHTLTFLGFDDIAIDFMGKAYNQALFNS